MFSQKNENDYNRIPVVYKKPTPIYCKLCRVLAAGLILLRVALLIGNLFGFSLYLFDVAQAYWYLLLDVLILGSVVCSLHFKQRGLYILPALACVVIIGIYAANLIPYMADTRYTEFVSPSKEKTVVLKERSYLFSGETQFYEKKSLFLEKIAGEFSYDDGYQSITSARLVTEWNEDESIIKFSYYDASDKLFQEIRIAVKDFN